MWTGGDALEPAWSTSSAGWDAADWPAPAPACRTSAPVRPYPQVPLLRRCARARSSDDLAASAASLASCAGLAASGPEGLVVQALGLPGTALLLMPSIRWSA